MPIPLNAVGIDNIQTKFIWTLDVTAVGLPTVLTETETVTIIIKLFTKSINFVLVFTTIYWLLFFSWCR